MLRIILILMVFFSLSACVSPMRFGISEAEWQNFSPEEKDRIKQGYYEILKNRSNNDERIVPDGSILHVKVFGGQVKMPPFLTLVSYTPIEFDLPNGESQAVQFKEENGNKKVTMRVYYKNKTLFLDPSRYDPEKGIGSIQLHYSPIWDRGFTYENVSSNGYVHLNRVNVTVRRYNSSEQEDKAD